MFCAGKGKYLESLIQNMELSIKLPLWLAFWWISTMINAQLDGVVPWSVFSCPSGPHRPSGFQGHGDSILSILLYCSYTLPYLLLFHTPGTADLTWWKNPYSSAVSILKHPADSPAGLEFSWQSNTAKELRLLGLVPASLDLNFPQTCCATHGRLLNLFEFIFYTSHVSIVMPAYGAVVKSANHEYSTNTDPYTENFLYHMESPVGFVFSLLPCFWWPGPPNLTVYVYSHLCIVFIQRTGLEGEERVLHSLCLVVGKLCFRVSWLSFSVWERRAWCIWKLQWLL